MENTFVADIQFFRGNDNEIILKSFSFSELLSETAVVQQFIFKPPFDLTELDAPRRRAAERVTVNHHQLDWTAGLIDYDRAEHIVRACLTHATEVVVKGREKVVYLNSVLRRNVCFNIDNLECPTLSVLKTNNNYLSNHTNAYFYSPASFSPVAVLKKWLRKLLANSLTLCNAAMGAFHAHGFFALTQRELYFLPVQFLIHVHSGDFLRSQRDKLAPHIAFNVDFTSFRQL